MPRKKSASAPPPSLFAENESVVAQYRGAVESTKKLKATVDYSGLGLSGGNFGDYIANGRSNNIGWKPLPPEQQKLVLTQSEAVEAVEGTKRDKKTWFQHD